MPKASPQEFREDVIRVFGSLMPPSIRHALTVVVTLLLFVAFAFWTGAWTRTAEVAQLTSMPVIVLVVLGQIATAFPEDVRRWIDLTPGAAMSDLVRASWFGFETEGTDRALGLNGSWAAAGEPLLVLGAWTVLAVFLARPSMRWEPRS